MVVIKRIGGQLTGHPHPVPTALGRWIRHVCSAISGRKLKAGSGDCLNSNVIDGRDYRQRTRSLTNVMDVISGGCLNGLHGANVHLACSPSINRSLHKQPIELSPLLFLVYHRPCSYNKLHTSSIVANQYFLAIFLKPSCLSGSTGSTVSFYRKASIGNVENSHAERKPGIFSEFQAKNEVGSGKLLCAWFLVQNGELNTALNWKMREKSLPMHWEKWKSACMIH